MYLAKIDITYVCKNKLEKEILELLKSNDRLVIYDSDIQIFTTKILFEISQLNAKHFRCKPIRASFDNHGGEKDFSLFLGGKICYYTLYHGERRDW